MPQKPPPHTGTPALPPLQVQPDLHSPHWQCLLSPVLPYPSGTVLPLRQAALSFLWRHLHSLRYWTFFFARIGYFISSVFENFFSPYSFSGLSAKVRNMLAIFCPASLMPVPKASIFPMLLSTSAMDSYTFWRIFSNFFLIPRNSTTLFKATFPCSRPLSYCSCGADQSIP